MLNLNDSEKGFVICVVNKIFFFVCVNRRKGMYGNIRKVILFNIDVEKLLN